MVLTVPAEASAQFVICVGFTADAISTIARAAGSHAVVLMAPDAASLRALLVQESSPPPIAVDEGVIERGALQVDVRAREVLWAGARIELSVREFDLLATLATDAGKVWTFDELMSRIWKTRYLGDAEMVVSTVKRLRRRLARAVDGLRVVSVRGVGFRLVVPD